MKHLFSLYSVALIMLLSLGLVACSKNDDYRPDPNIVGQWLIPLSPRLEVPAVQNRKEVGQLKMILYKNDTIKYEVVLQDKAAGDSVSMMQIHAGNAVSNGDAVLNFDAVFSNGRATGMVGLRPSLRDSLLNLENQLYFNVHSVQLPNGLVRGQVNTDVLYAADVALSDTNVVPAVTAKATGKAILRVTNEKKLYSAVSVEGFESGDVLTKAGIYSGSAGTTGSEVIAIAQSAAEFGVPMVRDLSAENYNIIRSQPTYVNVHSTMHTGGVVRGQLPF